MRLRQVALIAEKIAPVVGQLQQVFGLKEGHHDPGVDVFGLTNAVFPVGGEFLEVLEPFREDASGARYLQRRGGDAGYMIILQDAESYEHRARLEAAGVRIVARNAPGSRYHFTHVHPADAAGVLLSIESVEGDANWRLPKSDWPAAGQHWREQQSEESLGIPWVAMQARDPLAAAERWSMLLGKPVSRAGERLEIVLDPGVIRFVEQVDADGSGVVAMGVRVRHPRE
ncbi:MAG TPA: hypothetical protein VKT30_07380, partial [Caulobacteraceae bacterium]|nr:hypothetical protein [Caulobacteraceae bacterium]